jgi:hypothetical protein
MKLTKKSWGGSIWSSPNRKELSRKILGTNLTIFLSKLKVKGTVPIKTLMEKKEECTNPRTKKETILKS